VQAQPVLHFAFTEIVQVRLPRARCSATCADKRMCPASTAIKHSLRTLIPDPAKFVLSLTSMILLTGPL